MSTNKHKVYQIYTNATLIELREFLETYAEDKSQIGVMHSVYDKDGNMYKETNRTIVNLDPKVFNSLQGEGFTKRSKDDEYDFRITPYKLLSNDVPANNCLYILTVLVKNITQLSFDRQLDVLMNKLIHAGFIGKSDYKIEHVSKSGAFKGQVYIRFSDNISKDTISLIKLLLHQTLWMDDKENTVIARVRWTIESIYSQQTIKSKKN